MHGIVDYFPFIKNNNLRKTNYIYKENFRHVNIIVVNF